MKAWFCLYLSLYMQPCYVHYQEEIESLREENRALVSVNGGLEEKA